MASGKANSRTSSGAATAVVRAPESAESLPLNNVLPEETSSSQQDGSEPPAPNSEESVPSPDHSETSEINAPAIASEPTEGAESAESSETMDQLLDQFAVPEPAIAEGEIFDGRVLAVTDLGVIVDVGRKV